MTTLDFTSLPTSSLVASALACVEALGRASQVFWDASVFEKDTWTKLMNGLRIALTMGGALLLVYEFRARRLRKRIQEQKRVAIVMTLLAFGVIAARRAPPARGVKRAVAR